MDIKDMVWVGATGSLLFVMSQSLIQMREEMDRLRIENERLARELVNAGRVGQTEE